MRILLIVAALSICLAFRIPQDISLDSRVRDYGATDSIPTEVLKGWLVQEIEKKDPDATSLKDMIGSFFEESVGTARLAINSVAQKVSHFLKTDYNKKLQAMQQYLIELYGIDRSDTEFIDQIKSKPHNYFLTFNEYKILKDLKAPINNEL